MRKVKCPVPYDVMALTGRRTRDLDLREYNTASNMVIIIIINITHPFLRQVHSLFRSQFYTQCDLVLPISVPSISHFVKVIRLLLRSSSSSPHHIYLSFNNVF
jgi:hypothetical protein